MKALAGRLCASPFLCRFFVCFRASGICYRRWRRLICSTMYFRLACQLAPCQSGRAVDVAVQLLDKLEFLCSQCVKMGHLHYPGVPHGVKNLQNFCFVSTSWQWPFTDLHHRTSHMPLNHQHFECCICHDFKRNV